MKRILVTLDDLQVQRKALVVLNEERVTKYQYAIVILLALALVGSFLSIDSTQNIMESIIKAILVTTVGVVVWTLHQFDELRIFEGNVGEHTAQDMIDIIKGKK